MLCLDTWNDGFRQTSFMPFGVANINPNIIHVVTKMGAHCLRREGWMHQECWLSKVSCEFAQAIVSHHAAFQCRGKTKQ